MLAALFATALMPPQDAWPQTRAERTAYRETSHYDDVIAFLEALDKKGAPIRITYMGVSTEGRKMPLVVAARPMVSSPEEAHRAGKAVVYVQANIHAGEVEGKEAAQMLLRRVSQDPHGLLDHLVLVVDPIYNADGNEKFAPGSRNRPGQNGPDEVGVRTNGQGFDLNRDCMKAESPEMRGVLEHVYAKWNPDAMMDLHTTNGTRHGYGLTYSPPLNPNTDPEILAYSRDQLLPDVRKELRDQYKLETFDYGNTARRDSGQAWLTFGEEPRYVTNYAGVRGRIGVLSEAFSYLPFEERVIATDRFVAAVLGRLARDAAKVIAMAKAADARAVAWGSHPETAPQLGVRFEMDQRGTEAVLLEKPAEQGAPRRTGKPTEFVEASMPIFDRFKTSKAAPLPAAYLLPASEKEVAALLRRHGIDVRELSKPWKGEADRFHIAQRNQDASPFQGHRLIRLEGTFERKTVEFPAGSFLVPTNTPLAVLTFHLLEPESLDGAAAWGFFADMLSEGTEYPVAKLWKRPGA
ncbi:MAG: M14 family metallopeptidase [Fimbriimonadaceae bacterium]|nr:M14 family metallopeptidase [Chthonomonadaceae bacterium]MCO5296051.1 M14 family metallopeptidase [Fimbriimonadaceae bacterium]